MPKSIISLGGTLSQNQLLKMPLVLGVMAYFALFSHNLLAQAQTNKNDGLTLKLEDQLVVRPIVPDNEAPTFTSSKQVDGVMDRQIKLQGDAVIRRNHNVIKGDVITYDPDTDIAEAEGNAVVIKDTTVFRGPKAKLKVDAQEGWMLEPNYELRDIGGSGKANRVDFQEGNEFELTKMTYTTCRPDSVDWYLTASQMDVESDTNVATGTNGVLHFFNVPVLYTPFFSLPTGSGRRSGFLSPTYGRAKRGNWQGWDITVPYYVNIAPNRDLTLFPRYLQNRGNQLGGEFRYLDKNYAGTLNAEYLSNDQVYKKDRWAFGVKHAQRLAPTWTGYADVSKVSDNLYVDDLGKSLNGVVNRQFNQEAGSVYTSGPWTLLTRVQKFQTLQPDPNNLVTLPYEREPQVNAKYAINNPDGINWAVETDMTRFTYQGLKIDGTRPFKEGNRGYIMGSASRPYMTPGYYVTPKVSFRSTQYSVDPFPGVADVNKNITLPTFSLDSGLTLERDALEVKNIFGRDMLLTLEPRLFYVYTPYRYQSDLPLFDTADAGFGISQIFSENSFAGNDRISDNNKVTLGITSRILDSETGIERLRGILAQRIDIDGQRVGLTSDATTARRRTDILGGLATRLAGNFNLDTIAQYNPDVSRIVQSSITGSYRPDMRKLINLSYRSTYDPNTKTNTLNQYEASGQWPITRQWYGVARYNYDVISNRVLNRVVGLEYDADCWVVRVVQRRYQNTSVLATSEIYMQIDFKGFSGFGNNPVNLIRFNVPGYEPVSAIPAPVSPFESYE